MDILGIGVPELVFILFIALIVLGPRDMQKAGKTVGRWLNNIVRSQTWKDVRAASRRIGTLPNELMREANLDDLGDEFKKYRPNPKVDTLLGDQYGAWGGTSSTPGQQTENRIAPPTDEKPVPVKSAHTQTETDTPKTTPENHA